MFNINVDMYIFLSVFFWPSKKRVGYHILSHIEWEEKQQITKVATMKLAILTLFAILAVLVLAPLGEARRRRKSRWLPRTACYPVRRTTKAFCLAKIPKCLKRSSVLMKWVGTGCPGENGSDGGCQCAEFW